MDAIIVSDIYKKFIRELREENGTTMLLTTHDTSEADTLCDRIAIMDQRKVIALDTPQALKAMIPPKNGIEVTLELTGCKLVTEEEEPV